MTKPSQGLINAGLAAGRPQVITIDSGTVFVAVGRVADSPDTYVGFEMTTAQLPVSAEVLQLKLSGLSIAPLGATVRMPHPLAPGKPIPIFDRLIEAIETVHAHDATEVMGSLDTKVSDALTSVAAAGLWPQLDLAQECAKRQVTLPAGPKDAPTEEYVSECTAVLVTLIRARQSGGASA